MHYGIPVGFPLDGSQFHYSLHDSDRTGEKIIGNLEDRNKEAVCLLRLLVSHC